MQGLSYPIQLVYFYIYFKIINFIDIFENVPRLVFKKNIVIVLDKFYRS